MFTSALRSDATAANSETSADLPASVRVDARLELGVLAKDGDTHLSHRLESGAFRFRFPRSHGAPPEAVLVNIAGGLAGGDRVSTAVSVGEGASLALTSAAAERVYRSAGESTRLTSHLRIENRATLLWMPQETILYDGTAVERRFEIDLAADARLAFVEMLYFGRRAAGEGFRAGTLRESWRVRHAGRLVLADECRMEADPLSPYTHPALLGDHVALATILFACPDAGEVLEAVRALLHSDEAVEAAATDLGPLVLVRLLSRDAARIRSRAIELAIFFADRIGQPMPRALLN